MDAIVLLVGSASTFWGMHTAGCAGYPRRIPDAPDMLYTSGYMGIGRLHLASSMDGTISWGLFRTPVH
jgi:heme/copper-type cytochrome/quinol oxidase subunit 1